MEKLIQELYSPANQSSSARIQDLQRQIQHLQRERAAWQLGLDFLGHSDANIRFYGALTLVIKINADWDNDGISGDSPMQGALLEALISHYIRLALSGDASFVVQKLCSTLAVLYQRLVDTWQAPVRHVTASLLAQRFVSPDALPARDELLAALASASPKHISAAVRLAATLAEDVYDRTGKQGGELLNHLSESCLDVFELLDIGLSLSLPLTDDSQQNQISASDLDAMLDLAQMSIQATIPWHSLLGTQTSRSTSEETKATGDAVTSVLSKTLQLYTCEDLQAYVLQTLIAVQQTSPRLLIKADPAFPKTFMNSPATQLLIHSLQQGTFDHEEMLLVDMLEAIMSQVDATTPEYLADDNLSDVLGTLLLLLRCEGVATVEDSACQPILEIVNQLVDGRTDWTGETHLDIFKAFVQQACEACYMKATMPLEEMSVSTQTWDVDDRSKFAGFRFDVQDFFLASYPVLGGALITALTRHLSSTVEPPDWPMYEVSIISLRAFADNLLDDSELLMPYIDMAMNSRPFQAVLQSPDVPDQARKTTIGFIADYTSLLKQHSGLPQILDFLFTCLHHNAAANSASQAIYTLCYDQRASLVKALPGFLSSLSSVTDVEDIDRHRVYGGVAAIIQALNTEEAKIEPLKQMLRLLNTAMDKMTGAADRELIVSVSTDILQGMAAIGRGLRTPNDITLENEFNDSVEPDFWTSGNGSEIQQEVLALYHQVARNAKGYKDSGLIEAKCDFLRSGLTEEHPAAFKFTAQTSTQLVTELIVLESANIDSVLGCASSLLGASSKEDMAPYLTTLLSPVLSTVQQMLNTNRQSGGLYETSFASAALEFAARMVPKYIDILLSLQEGQQAIHVIIELALILLSEQDILPRRSAATFVGGLLDTSKPQKTLSDTTRARLGETFQQYSPRIIAVLLHLIAGECSRSELEMLCDPIRRYVQYQPMLFKMICKELVKDTGGVLSQQALKNTTIEQRNRLIAQIDGLRGQRKTNELVKEFWISCRGAGFDYIA